MSREEAIRRLKECQENWDTESAHMNADQVLIDLLKSLGYEDVIAEYDKVEMWYA